MLATPCTTFSIARDRTAVIRDARHPWGVENASDKDAQKLLVGNACARASIRIIKAAILMGIPW
eukprot:7533292-Heterocapsa_arctica.AAC.1